jgi:hypothetical protein
VPGSGLLRVATAGRAKKLERVAELWANGGPQDDSPDSPLEVIRQWGATPEQIEEWRKALAVQAQFEEGEVWPENWHAVQLFLAMGTQWRCAAGALGVLWIGLDYSPLWHVNATLRRSIPRELRVSRRREIDLLDQIHILEVAAVKARNE